MICVSIGTYVNILSLSRIWKQSPERRLFRSKRGSLSVKGELCGKFVEFPMGVIIFGNIVYKLERGDLLVMPAWARSRICSA